MLSAKEQERYSRHFVLPGFGMQAQERLKQARVLVVGAGGLGAPLVQYLTAAGIGTLGIADFDKVSLSNLQRQVLFSTDSIGKNKAQVAKLNLQKLNPHVAITTFEERLTAQNILAILQQFDVVADGTDNFATRYLINDACVLMGKPLVYGSVHGYEGQCSVFNYKEGVNYRDIHPTPPAPETVPNCAQGGILGALPGAIGSIMALEVIKLAAGLTPGLAGKLYLFDSLLYHNQIIKLGKPKPENKVKELIDYDAFCASSLPKTTAMQTITATDLKTWLAQEPQTTHLIDVRDNFERSMGHIGGTHIPLPAILELQNEIPTQGKVVFYCSGGVRSAYAIEQLQHHPNAKNFYNLENGLATWQTG